MTPYPIFCSACGKRYETKAGVPYSGKACSQRCWRVLEWAHACSIVGKTTLSAEDMDRFVVEGTPPEQKENS